MANPRNPLNPRNPWSITCEIRGRKSSQNVTKLGDSTAEDAEKNSRAKFHSPFGESPSAISAPLQCYPEESRMFTRIFPTWIKRKILTTDFTDQTDGKRRFLPSVKSVPSVVSPSETSVGAAPPRYASALNQIRPQCLGSGDRLFRCGLAGSWSRRGVAKLFERRLRLSRKRWCRLRGVGRHPFRIW